jgi:hypothetical protein
MPTIAQVGKSLLIMKLPSSPCSGEQPRPASRRDANYQIRKEQFPFLHRFATGHVTGPNNTDNYHLRPINGVDGLSDCAADRSL